MTESHPMNITMILTVTSPDRTGLVESIAKTVAQHDGNWVQSSMSRLAGRFAGVVRVDVPRDKADALGKALAQLDQQGLHIRVEQVADDVPDQPARRLHLEIIGQDHPGIIRDVTQLLTHRNINVIDLTTRVESAPWSGEQLFRAKANLVAPADLPVDELRQTLEALGQRIAVDITLEDRGYSG